MLRAVHQLLDAPLVFEDPLALAVVAPSLVDELRRDPRRFGGSWLGRYLRAFLAVRSRFAELDLAVVDAELLARHGAGWVSAVEDLGNRDPHAAGKLAAAMLAHLARYRPESPAPLDADFAPTEAPPTRPPGAET